MGGGGRKVLRVVGRSAPRNLRPFDPGEVFGAVFSTPLLVKIGLRSVQQERAMPPASSKGIIRKQSSHSVEDTVGKLRGILQAKGIALFALIDHSGEAEKVGLQMPPTKLLIFGNPKAGTPLMLASPGCAIDLPLKILVAQDADGKVWLSYNDPAFLIERHSLPAEFLPVLAGVEMLAAKSAE
jgi:uncharacterized protein (DUF302 family)